MRLEPWIENALCFLQGIGRQARTRLKSLKPPKYRSTDRVADLVAIMRSPCWRGLDRYIRQEASATSLDMISRATDHARSTLLREQTGVPKIFRLELQKPVETTKGFDVGTTWMIGALVALERDQGVVGPPSRPLE